MWVRVTAQTGPLLCESITGGGMVEVVEVEVVNYLNVSTAMERRRQEGWQRHLALCKELSRRQGAAQRQYQHQYQNQYQHQYQNQPGITALAVSR